MSELKSFIVRYNGKFIRAYEETKADKVIADLEESHKMEVEQLLMEIVELKAQKAQAEDDCAYWKMSEGNAVTTMHETEEYAMQLYNELRHQKFKRCLAMAKWCDSEMNYWYDRIEMEQCQRFKFYDKWQKRWLELANQFNPNSTAPISGEEAK